MSTLWIVAGAAAPSFTGAMIGIAQVERPRAISEPYSQLIMAREHS